jgi:hypothetical protein
MIMAYNFDINQTATMLLPLEQGYQPSTLFRDTFFPNQDQSPTEEVLIDYRKGSRIIAPFVSQDVGSVNVERKGFTTKTYKPPMMAPARTITKEDINQRSFGENVFSSITPEERAMAMRAKDLVELADMNTRRIELMCAQILTTGMVTVTGYMEDGKTPTIDTITYADWTQKETLSGSDKWDNVDTNGNYTADMYGQMQGASQEVARNSSRVPDVAIGSYKTCGLMLKNKGMLDKMMVPSRDNLALMQFQPKIVSPGVIRFGYIQELNLDIYAYDGVYDDGTGVLEQYIPDGYFVIANSGRGTQLYGAITQIDQDEQFHTYMGRNIPKYWVDRENDHLKLRVASRCVPKPEFVDDWYTIKAF